VSTHRDDIPSRHPVSAESDALYGTNTDLEERKEVEALLAGENRLLESLDEGASLDRFLWKCRRWSDIPLLVEYFAHGFAKRAGRKIVGIDSKAVELLRAYPWH